MGIITTHGNTDFDALASLVLAKKLYPDYRVLLPQQKNRDVLRFLALYRDVFFYLEEVCSSPYTGPLVLVDTQKLPSSLHGLSPVIVYDHHPPYQVPCTWQGVVEKVGAATTLLLEDIQRKGLECTSEERTLAALGLYSDTLSFMTPQTCSRDIQALLWIWERGFNQTVLREFLQSPMTQKQQQAFFELVQSGEEISIHGLSVIIFQYNGNLHGGKDLINKLMDTRDAQGAILILSHKRHHTVIVRSRNPHLPLGFIAQKLGGGGHPGAGAAKVKDVDSRELVSAIHTYMDGIFIQEPQAGFIMSSPVYTISQDCTVEKALALMEQKGIKGLIVGDEQCIQGVFSRRDAQKALDHGLTHAPVKGFMSRTVHTASPSMTLGHLQKLMIQHNIGRVPVVEDGKLLGIVTRSDILSFYHHG